MSEEGWVVEGINRPEIKDLVLPLATDAIWLDLPIWVLGVRLAKRTLRNVLLRAEVQRGSRETWRDPLAGGIVWRTVKATKRRQVGFHKMLGATADEGYRLHRLRTRRDVRLFLSLSR